MNELGNLSEAIYRRNENEGNETNETDGMGIWVYAWIDRPYFFGIRININNTSRGEIMNSRKRKYHVRAEHKNGKVVQGECTCIYIGNVIAALGRHGYIVTDHHEVFDRVKG